MTTHDLICRGIKTIVCAIALGGGLAGMARPQAPGGPACAGRGEWTLTLPAVTVHVPEANGLDNHNWGLGVERGMGRDWGLLAEGYRNSLDRASLVIGADWMPLRKGRFALGGAAGIDVLDGYGQRDGGWDRKGGLLGYRQHLQRLSGQVPAPPQGVSWLVGSVRSTVEVTRRWGVGVDCLPGRVTAVGVSVRWRVGRLGK